MPPTFRTDSTALDQEGCGSPVSTLVEKRIDRESDGATVGVGDRTMRVATGPPGVLVTVGNTEPPVGVFVLGTIVVAKTGASGGVFVLARGGGACSAGGTRQRW